MSEIAHSEPAPPPRRRWIWVLPLVALPLLVCCGGGLGALTWLSYEVGTYGTRNKIRISTPARKAALAALQQQPGTVMYIEEYESFAFRVRFVQQVSPHDRVVEVTERGVPMVIDAQAFHNFFDLMKPTIVHRGDDVTKGYEVILRGLTSRPSDFPGPGRP